MSRPIDITPPEIIRLHALLNTCEHVSGSSVKRILQSYLSCDTKFLEKRFTGTLDQTVSARAVVLMRKVGIIEDVELDSTGIYGKIRSLCMSLPYVEIEE